MDNSTIELLKQDLAKAIHEKNYVRVEELKHLLNISSEQEKYFERGLTGYPSVDEVWLQYYPEGYDEKAKIIPINQTIWDVFEKKILEYYDWPVMEYFARKISSPEFVEKCYMWARTFRGMGVEPGEVVPVYGPFVPDVCAMFFALNMIGATVYFLKLKISPEDLAEETKAAKIAVVFDSMWGNVAHEFSKDKFKNVMVYSATDDMPSPKKEIVSFLSAMKTLKAKSKIPDTKKYIWVDKAREIADYYSGNVKVPFEANRSSVITSSSGTTIGGVVKGTVATNESILGQIISGYYTGTPFYPGDRVLNHFPPTASTSLNSLFLLGLYNRSTIVVDPRVSEKDFYNQLIGLKPNVALSTGSAWEAFFNRVKREMQQGKKFDFSYAKGWTIGGEGIDTDKFLEWNEIMRLNHAFNLLFSGYGLSETFSAVSVDNLNAERDYSRPMVGVGIPQAGMTMGVFDENGNELPYFHRGELWIKTLASMKEYYNKPELTAQTKVDGWIRTGDLAEMDDKGFLYVWGRMKDNLEVNGNKVYLFDVANKIKSKDYISDALVLQMPTEENENNLVAHIVWKDEVLDDDKLPYLEELNELMREFLPEGIELYTYSAHDTMIPYSPTTLKKDKNGLSNQTLGYMQVTDGKLEDVGFNILPDGKHYSKFVQERKSNRLFKRRKEVA